MRAVLDSNILFSALISPHGPPHRIYQAWRERRLALVTCPAQLDEIRRASAIRSSARFSSRTVSAPWSTPSMPSPRRTHRSVATRTRPGSSMGRAVLVTGDILRAAQARSSRRIGPPHRIYQAWRERRLALVTPRVPCPARRDPAHQSLSEAPLDFPAAPCRHPGQAPHRPSGRSGLVAVARHEAAVDADRRSPWPCAKPDTPGPCRRPCRRRANGPAHRSTSGGPKGACPPGWRSSPRAARARAASRRAWPSAARSRAPPRPPAGWPGCLTGSSKGRAPSGWSPATGAPGCSGASASARRKRVGEARIVTATAFCELALG